MRFIHKLPFVFLICLLLTSLCPATPPSGKPEENSLFIKGATIISPKGKSIKVYIGNVLIENGKISYVGKLNPANTSAADIIDGRGKFLIPGLIDSHVHLANVAGLNFKLKRKHQELATSYYSQLPKSYLYFGFTTVIDPNNHSPEVLNSIKKSKVRPDIYTCSKQLEVMDGFMMAETEPKNRYRFNPNFLHDRFNKSVSIRSGTILGEHTPRALIKKVVKDRGICTKIAFENGFGGTEDVTWEMPSHQIVRELSKEARKRNIPVLLHANSFESQKFAYDNKVQIIAHGMWHWGNLKTYLRVKALPQSHRSLLKKIAKRQMGYQSTFRVIAGQRDVFDDNFIFDENLEHVYPRKFLKWLKTDEGKWQQKNIKKYAKGFFDGMENTKIASFMQLMVDKIAVSTKHLADNNGNLLFGSDTPAGNAHTNPPGYNGYLEMKEWAIAGVSLKGLFRAATIANAKAFNIKNHYGSIEKGKIANLLLLKKNPLESISAYDSIETIILNGESYKRNKFSALSKP